MREHDVAGTLWWFGGRFRATLLLCAILSIYNAGCACLHISSAAEMIEIDRPAEDGRARLRVYGNVEIVAPPGKDQSTLRAEANMCLVPFGGVNLYCMQNRFGDTVILSNGKTLGAAPNYPAPPSRQQPPAAPVARDYYSVEKWHCSEGMTIAVDRKEKTAEVIHPSLFCDILIVNGARGPLGGRCPMVSGNPLLQYDQFVRFTDNTVEFGYKAFGPGAIHLQVTHDAAYAKYILNKNGQLKAITGGGDWASGSCHK